MERDVREFLHFSSWYQCLSSGYHPQTNGPTERANQEMETALRCVTSVNPSSWSAQLPWVEYAHNTLTNASSGMSPFVCALGYNPPCSPPKRLRFPLSRTIRAVVTVPGGRLGLPCVPPTGPSPKPTIAGPQLQSTPRVKRYGSHQRTYHFIFLCKSVKNKFLFSMTA